MSSSESIDGDGTSEEDLLENEEFSEIDQDLDDNVEMDDQIDGKSDIPGDDFLDDEKSDCDSLINGNDLLNCSESSSDEEEFILNDKINENLTPDTEEIFDKANISLEEFRRSFLILQDQFNLSSSQAKGVFEFVKSLFPNTHKLTTF